MADKYWLGWAEAYIEDVEEESPENMTSEYKEKIANFFKKMVAECKQSKSIGDTKFYMELNEGDSEHRDEMEAN